MKTPPIEHSAHHQKMLNTFFESHCDNWTSYEAKAAILWEGEYYVIIRTGMSETRSRYVWMADRAGLLFDESSHLAQLASTLIHPGQVERAQENTEILHDSDQSDQSEGIFKGRWCKKRLAACIKYAQEKELTYEADLENWIRAYDEREEASLNHARRKRSYTAKLLRYARKRVGNTGRVRTPSRSGGLPHDDREISDLSDRLSMCFCTNEDDWLISIRPRRWGTFNLTEKQFYRFVDFVADCLRENAESGNSQPAGD